MRWSFSFLALSVLLYFVVDLPWGLPLSFQTHYVPEAIFFFLCGYGIKSTKSYGLLAAVLVGPLLIAICVAWINPGSYLVAEGAVTTVFAASTLIGFKIRE